MNFLHVLLILWEVGSKRPVGIIIEKAWNLTFAYSLQRGSCKTLQTRNKQITPTPNMKCHQTEQSNKGCSAGGIYISQRAFTAFLFWVCEILQDFAVPKQALINAFYNMSAKPIARIALQRYYKICGCARKIAF